jgi:hypothetical protein
VDHYQDTGLRDCFKTRDKDNGDTIVYDNQMDTAEDADPATSIGGGGIVIREAK